MVATRDGTSGQLKLYLEGVAVGNGPGPTTYLSGDIDFGSHQNGSDPFAGLLDEVKLYATVLGTDTVTALYDRTQQAYCVAASNSSYPWLRISFPQPDTRGGKLTSTGRLRS